MHVVKEFSHPRGTEQGFSELPNRRLCCPDTYWRGSEGPRRGPIQLALARMWPALWVCQGCRKMTASVPCDTAVRRPSEGQGVGPPHLLQVTTSGCPLAAQPGTWLSLWKERPLLHWVVAFLCTPLLVRTGDTWAFWFQCPAP